MALNQHKAIADKFRKVEANRQQMAKTQIESPATLYAIERIRQSNTSTTQQELNTTVAKAYPKWGFTIINVGSDEGAALDTPLGPSAN